MLTAIVLVCAIGASQRVDQCDRFNARDVLVIPYTFSNPAMCVFQGQAYLASALIGSFDTKIYQAKVICVDEAVGRELGGSPRAHAPPPSAPSPHAIARHAPS
jgi:hypothetical protein